MVDVKRFGTIAGRTSELATKRGWRSYADLVGERDLADLM